MASDSIFLSQFDFSDNRYVVADALDFTSKTGVGANHNQIGIHQRGCGFTPKDTTYVLPHDTVEFDATKRAQLIAEQQVVVDSLILTESALEFAFEGTRYYDIMRYALHQKDPAAAMRKILQARRGSKNTASIPLTDKNSWFLKWNGKIGIYNK